ncbi:hypothetical protein SAMN02787142_0025 [Burkholderia sp. WP9]|uniref:hypothetical protein n=1 Tax=Burkholderia sp. WP9 TaxID=1500263 RepID=UPI0008954EA6|nr:hypothetical protein [Burkholderia sp. WP9]SEB60892.1 hypothetical protein SAMN02787142_0025 [Burkholderia sp. WP9]
MPAPHNAENVDTFLRTISPWGDAYGAATLSFVAVKREDSLEVVHAHLVLPNGPIARSDLRFETTSLLAGRFRLDMANLTVEQAVRDFADAGLETPFGRLRLLLDADGTLATFLQLWKTGLRDGEARTIALALSGSARPLGQDELPYFTEVRSCATPFASLDEMAIAVNDIPLRRDISLLEITAANCVQVDFGRRVTGTAANPALVLSPNLDESKASLGLAIFNRGAEPTRVQYSGDQLQWQVDERGFNIGTIYIDVPEGSAIRCFAAYDGAPQCIGWIGDPEKMPNLRYALHATFDAELQVLQRYLLDEDHHQKHSRDFETGVAALLFMLGFSVEALAGKPLENGPDLVATTPKGELVLVECTIGQINKDGKLGKLVDRAASVRRSLQGAGHNPARVLPVIVSPRPLEAIADITAANSMGVVVFTREDLEAGLQLARNPQDPDDLIAKQWEKLQRQLDAARGQMDLFATAGELP